MGKPSLSKAALNSNQIFFNAELHDGDDLPAHIRYVWDCLLDFREAIFQDHKKNYEKDYELFLTRSHSHISDETLRFFRPQENHLSKYEDELEAEDDDDQFVEKSKHARKESVKKAREFTKHVLELQRETAWVHNLVANLFQRSNERLMLRADLQDLDRWSLEENCAWTAHEWRQPQKTTSLSKEQPLTRPQPDLTYAFPMLNAEDTDSGWSKSDHIQTFTAKFLKGLASDDFRFTATRGIYTKKFHELNSADRLCFPWAVVEVKHAEVRPAEADKCFFQAANGAAAGLDAFRSLYLSVHDDDADDLLPVLAFTCVGPELKLWLTYLDAPTGDINMNCVFVTNLELAWGVLQTSMIVRNMKNWALRDLRPKLAERLRYAKKRLNTHGCLKPPSFRYPMAQFLPDDEHEQADDEDTAPISSRTRSRQSTPNGTPNSSLSGRTLFSTPRQSNNTNALPRPQFSDSKHRTSKHTPDDTPSATCHFQHSGSTRSTYSPSGDGRRSDTLLAEQPLVDPFHSPSNAGRRSAPGEATSFDSRSQPPSWEKSMPTRFKPLSGNREKERPRSSLDGKIGRPGKADVSASVSPPFTPPSMNRKPWTQAEVYALLSGLEQVGGPYWAQILRLHGRSGSVSEALKNRSQVQLKDKARNLKLGLLRAGQEVPKMLRNVTGELNGGTKHRQSSSKDPENEEGDILTPSGLSSGSPGPVRPANEAPKIRHTSVDEEEGRSTDRAENEHESADEDESADEYTSGDEYHSGDEYT